MKVNQRTDEWELRDKRSLEYHLSQWGVPKRSTVAFERFVSDWLGRSKTVMDLACGSGAATAFLASRFPEVLFEGVDLSGELVSSAGVNAGARGLKNAEFRVGDWYGLEGRGDVDGVVSLQTLSWLPDYKEPLRIVFERLSPDWMAVSSLFYPGDISCTIEVNEHSRARRSFYNVYSLPDVSRFVRQFGYEVVRYEPFEIDLDIEPPLSIDEMGTYTRRLASDSGDKVSRLQLSGPLLMNWYMVGLRRT